MDAPDAHRPLHVVVAREVARQRRQLVEHTVDDPLERQPARRAVLQDDRVIHIHEGLKLLVVLTTFRTGTEHMPHIYKCVYFINIFNFYRNIYTFILNNKSQYYNNVGFQQLILNHEHYDFTTFFYNIRSLKKVIHF